MVAQFVAVLSRHALLHAFDVDVHELFDAPATQTHDVVVMLAFGKFIRGAARIEVVAHQNARRFKLRQNAVDRRQSDVALFLHQHAVDVFGGEMPNHAFPLFGDSLKELQNLHAGTRRLQTERFEFRGLVSRRFVHLLLPLWTL